MWQFIKSPFLSLRIQDWGLGLYSLYFLLTRDVRHGRGGEAGHVGELEAAARWPRPRAQARTQVVCTGRQGRQARPLLTPVPVQDLIHTPGLGAPQPWRSLKAKLSSSSMTWGPKRSSTPTTTTTTDNKYSNSISKSRLSKINLISPQLLPFYQLPHSMFS